MGLRTLANKNDDRAVLYCSTFDTAFGPVIYADAGCADYVASAFCQWLPRDAREYTQGELSAKYSEFRCLYAGDDCNWEMEKIHAILASQGRAVAC